MRWQGPNALPVVCGSSRLLTPSPRKVSEEMKTAAPKKKAKSAPCKCVEQVDAKLAEFNTKLSRSLALDFSAGSASTHLSIATTKIDPKKRGSAKTVFVNYCPFCGKKL